MTTPCATDQKQDVRERHRLLRALIAARDQLVLHGLRGTLRGMGIEVVGSAGSAGEARQQAGALLPDLVLLEAQLLGEGDAGAITALKAAAPQAVIVVVSVSEEPEGVAQAIALGASAYLCRVIPEDGLELAVRAALRSCVLMDRVAFAGLARAVAPAPGAACRELVPAMTRREWEVLDLMATSARYREIAAALGLAVPTVRTHASRILRKLNLPNRTQAALWAREHGLGAGRGTGDT